MSTKNKYSDPLWPRRIVATRIGIIRTLGDIERGAIDTDDLDKLRAFCLFALKLMEQKGPFAWDEAKAGAVADYEAAVMHEQAEPGQRPQGRVSALVEAARAVGKLRPGVIDDDLDEAYRNAINDALSAIKTIAA